MRLAFVVPLACFVVIVYYGFYCLRHLPAATPDAAADGNAPRATPPRATRRERGIELRRDDFRDTPRMLYRTDATVTAFAYPSGVEALKLENRRGHLVVLPYLGQMIWAAAFDGRDLTMKHMFRQPKRAASIIDTYGCFMFHGLLRNGCPGPDDTHALHGEMPCAPMDRASVVVGADARARSSR